jgi:two-component system response regulator HydG
MTRHAQRPRLLIVDDDRAILTLIGTVALGEGFDVATTTDGSDALRQLRQRAADLVLVDLRMPGVSGMDVLRHVRDVAPRCRVVLMSGYATIDSAVEAVKLGAMDYLTKPFDMQRLRQLLAGVRAEADARRAVFDLEGELAQRVEFCGIVGRGPAMQDVFDLIRRLAPHARTAMVTGETGTGKELAARALHAHGPRSGQPFVVVDCRAAVEGLFDGDAILQADGGTLFLDEVAELASPVQARLLRLIENGEVHRGSSAEPVRLDVRIVAATSRDLRAEVAAGRFRTDLYYRLNVAEVALPPLRHRREDIPYLTAAFVRTLAGRFDKAIIGLTPTAERILAAAPWEGNVRQLRNVLERACMIADGALISEAQLAGVMEQLQAPGRAQTSSFDDPNGLPAPLQEIEREHIVRTMEQVRGNKAVAARLLGISRRAFYRQLERHGLHHRMSMRGRTGPRTAAMEQAS